METLKMTAYWYNPKPPGVREWTEVPYLETDKSSWWYLHGELQEIIGFDKALVTNVKSGGFSKDTIDWTAIDNRSQVTSVRSGILEPVMHVTGVVPVEIEGIPRKCLGYFWIDDTRDIFWEGQKYPYWKQRGVVVLKDNKNDMEYAEKLFREQPKIY
jgi:hypothetical protein